MSSELPDEEEYNELIREPRRVGWIWIVYLLLFALTIPWYWPAGYRGPIVLGLPLWVVVSLVGVLLLGGWTAWVIQRFWRQVGEEG